MADQTKAEMIDRTLRRLTVLAAGQTASGNDSALVGPVLDSLHSQLRKKGLCPFATSAFPDWAQESFAKALCEEVGPYYGKPRPGWRQEAEEDLTEQMTAKRHRLPARVLSF
jgi:hypothetical protein